MNGLVERDTSASTPSVSRVFATAGEVGGSDVDRLRDERCRATLGRFLAWLRESKAAAEVEGLAQPLEETDRRQALLRAISVRGSATASELAAADGSISRQGVAKHLQKLVEAGLLTSRREGREMRYRRLDQP
jgi:DNA-binding transcriptional ArsR family regulator